MKKSNPLEVNIDHIYGCVRTSQPVVERRGDEVVCTRWRSRALSGIPITGECPLDDVDEQARAASCFFSQCLSSERDDKGIRLIRAIEAFRPLIEKDQSITGVKLVEAMRDQGYSPEDAAYVISIVQGAKYPIFAVLPGRSSSPWGSLYVSETRLSKPDYVKALLNFDKQLTRVSWTETLPDNTSADGNR